ncbi:MAG: hypothetical protein ACXADF_15130 [Candidatus Thorarchaeota archaeon]
MAEHTIEGIFDPASIEQVGYVTSGTQSARTEVDPSVTYDLPLDDTHGWVASQAEVDIWNLERLYAVNGSFDDGIAGVNLNPNGTVDYYPYGWTANSTDTDEWSDDVQAAGYEPSQSGYIIVQNEGGKEGQRDFGHSGGSRILWKQPIQNAPYTEDFILSFWFYYQNGPIYKNPGVAEPITGNCSVGVFIDGALVWNMSLLTLEQRGLWTNSGEIPLSVAGASSSFDFEIGLVIDETLILDKFMDYDNDTIDDGLINAAYITVFLDDLSFRKATPPTPAEVKLEFKQDTSTVAMTGSAGNGNASITNEYWTTDPVSVIISANTSVSFEYETRLLSHRFTDSTRSTDPSEVGAKYQIQSGEQSAITFLTYVGFLGGYEDTLIRMRFPSDWENATVLDPFLTDMTGLCSISPGLIVIPESILAQLGWWTVELQGYNYAQSMTTEKYSMGSWASESIFRSNDRTRLSLQLEAHGHQPDPVSNVNVSWLLPDQSEWYSETSLTGSNGLVESTSLTLGPINTTAGIWDVIAVWQNNTQVGFAEAQFEVHHSASLTPADPSIDTETGVVQTVFLNYLDAENGGFLMDPAASMTANWSLSTITFQPNEGRNQWEADFDTSLLPPGFYLVVVNVTQTYFDDASCTFTVSSNTTGNTLSLGETTKDLDLHQTYPLNMRFEDRYGSGIEGASFTFEIVSGTAGGITWGGVTGGSGGDYSVDLYSVYSDAYEISITAWKDHYKADQATLFLFVGELASEIILLNNSVQIIEFGEDFELFLEYVNGTSYGLDGADVVVLNPPSGLTISPTQNLTNGLYSITFTPTLSDTFTILISASISNHETQLTSFTLTVTPISSTLDLNYTSSIISFDQKCIIHFNLTSSLFGPLAGGMIVPANPPLGISLTDYEDLGGGIYRINATPTSTGFFSLSFVASALNHVNSTNAFTLQVVEASTQLRVSDGVGFGNAEFMSTYDLLLYFERTDTPSNVSGAIFDISFATAQTLPWSVTPSGTGYLLSIQADEVGRWDMTIAASKENHIDAAIRFVLYVNEIDTEFIGTGPLDALYYGRSYSFTYEYRILSSQIGIDEADNSISGAGSNWATLIPLGSGEYNITVVPEDVGSFSVVIEIWKSGFQRQNITFSFLVSSIPITVQLDTPSWTDGQPLVLSVTLTDDLGQPVINATVAYELNEGLSQFDYGEMHDDDDDGVYLATISGFPNMDLTYNAYIAVSMEYHETTQSSYQSTVILIESTEGLILRIWRDYGIPAVGAFAVLGIVGSSYRIRSKRREAYMAKALAVKRRFDDANNLIGIIILHKTSGLPVYSNILKGGFEEGMISAFITAITHFRSEFDRDDYDLAFEVLPISDIIRAVPTRNLVCAFITVSSASMQQEARMVEFARGVSKLMDDDSAERPTEVNNIAITDLLERFFDEVMEGFLLRYYKRGRAGSFPKRYRCLEDALNFTEAADCSRPTYLAIVMTERCKITEAEASLLVLEAIEAELVVPCSKHEVISFAPAHRDDGKDLPEGPVRM